MTSRRTLSFALRGFVVALAVTFFVLTAGGALFGGDVDDANAVMAQNAESPVQQAGAAGDAAADDSDAAGADEAEPAAGSDEAEPAAGSDEAEPAAGSDEAEPAVVVQTPIYQRLISLIGVFAFVGIAVLFSTDRKAINWRLVGVGMTLQLALGLLILKTPVGEAVFRVVGEGFNYVLGFTQEGNKLLFGSFANNGEVMPSFLNFAFDVLPTIVFFSSLMALLYHAGVMQRIVQLVAAGMQKTMGTSGAETLSVAANIFVGQTEAPLMVRPYVGKMTMSELMAVMTGGFATVAGGVMAAYIGMLQQYIPDIAGHLLAASVMSAPAALVVAKVMYPETDTPETMGAAGDLPKSTHANIIDAAAGGAADGLSLALNVGAMLLAFVALVAMFNFIIAIPFYIQHGVALKGLIAEMSASGLAMPDALAQSCDPSVVRIALEDRMGCIESIYEAVPDAAEVTVWKTITLQRILGYVFTPIALLTGAPVADATELGRLYGEKTILNEFYAYFSLMNLTADGAISGRTAIIASYGLCGFANLSSIAIQIGGIGGIAPERRQDLAKLGLRAVAAGTIAAWMTGNIAGLLL